MLARGNSNATSTPAFTDSATGTSAERSLLSRPANQALMKNVVEVHRSACLIAKLRGHGLVAKVPQCHLYRVTSKGHRLMAAALRVRYKDFPDALREAA